MNVCVQYGCVYVGRWVGRLMVQTAVVAYRIEGTHDVTGVMMMMTTMMMLFAREEEKEYEERLMSVLCLHHLPTYLPTYLHIPMRLSFTPLL